MGKLTSCSGCGGLKRIETERCPHCGQGSAGAGVRLAVAVLGFGALAACSSSQDAALTVGDGGMDGSYVNCCDAYGLVMFLDAGIPDAGRGDGGTDAGDGGD